MNKDVLFLNQIAKLWEQQTLGKYIFYPSRPKLKGANYSCLGFVEEMLLSLSLSAIMQSSSDDGHIKIQNHTIMILKEIHKLKDLIGLCCTCQEMGSVDRAKRVGI